MDLPIMIDLKIFSFMSGFWLLTILLTLLIGYFYLAKRMVRKKLFTQQKKINNSSERIASLIDENEILLREVHHRVKNNLQTVMSLLESQSHYLKDEALEAIKNSRGRIYSMSLIFKNIDGPEDSLQVNMESYIPELAQYIIDCLGNEKDVKVAFYLKPLKLDIGDAVALGLIINEGITNAVKFGLDAQGKCRITISSAYLEDDVCEVSISDQGPGIPENFLEGSNDSLGLKLIRGLCDQLQGDLKVEVSNGTRMSLRLCPKKLKKMNLESRESLRKTH